jgi:hypothetical protein
MRAVTAAKAAATVPAPAPVAVRVTSIPATPRLVASRPEPAPPMTTVIVSPPSAPTWNVPR